MTHCQSYSLNCFPLKLPDCSSPFYLKYHISTNIQPFLLLTMTSRRSNPPMVAGLRRGDPMSNLNLTVLSPTRTTYYPFPVCQWSFSFFSSEYHICSINNPKNMSPFQRLQGEIMLHPYSTVLSDFKYHLFKSFQSSPHSKRVCLSFEVSPQLTCV